MQIPSSLDRAGSWFLGSGIQDRSGGVARYYRSDTEQNQRISTEITGYAVSALVYLHSLTQKSEYLDRAFEAARFLTRVAWDKTLKLFPFEYSSVGDLPEPLAYFFDHGIIVRGLLAVWRAAGDAEFLEIAKASGYSMAQDFAATNLEFHPVLRLPEKQPAGRDERWSRAPGAYQLKAAMGWYELFEETGEKEFQELYNRVLEYALQTHGSFLPGHTDKNIIMDRLHAYCYFLEGLLPALNQKRCVFAFNDGIYKVSRHLREIWPQFDRSDVYAQLLRLRLFGESSGLAPVDRLAADEEAERLAQFQLDDADLRIKGGFCFGRKARQLMPFINPASTAFGVQALTMWRQYQAGELQASRQMLI